MPQDDKNGKKESIWDSFSRAFRAGRAASKNPKGGVKGVQSFAKEETKLANSKSKPKEMKDSRWFKRKKPDINLPISTKPSDGLLHRMKKTTHVKYDKKK